MNAERPLPELPARDVYRRRQLDVLSKVHPAAVKLHLALLAAAENLPSAGHVAAESRSPTTTPHASLRAEIEHLTREHSRLVGRLEQVQQHLRDGGDRE